MLFRRTVALAAAALLAANPVFSNETDKKSTKPAEASTGWNESQMQQPATESLDLGMYNAIREEGLEHSHVMDYAGGLIDGIGPRLTGSPNMAKANAWTRDQLTKMGCVNAHLEDWGEFGMGWQQLNTWVRMVEPDTAIFVAQATPWSPSTNGPVKARSRFCRHQRRSRHREVQRQARPEKSFCSARCAKFRPPTKLSSSATPKRN